MHEKKKKKKSVNSVCFEWKPFEFCQLLCFYCWILEDGLVAIRKALDARENKTVSTDSLIELVECVLKNNIFEHNTSFYKRLRGTAIGTKMAPPYAIIFMGDLEEKLLKDCDKKPLA